MKGRKGLLYFVLLVVGVLVLINILADLFFLRLDFTADKQYTLNKATKDILDELHEPVTVSSYFSENLPPEFARIRRDFKEMLVEYANRSKGKIVYEFINPNKDEDVEHAANQAGISPVLIDVRDKDQVKQQKAYLGAVVHYRDKSEIIPLIQSSSAMEFELSSAIKKLTLKEKQNIGFLQGQGEPNIYDCSQAMQALDVLYNIEPVTLNDSMSNLDKFTCIIIVNPVDSFHNWQLKQIDDYLKKGKNLLLAFSRVKGDMSKASGLPRNIGLESWLNMKGVEIDPSFIIDANCGSVQVQQQQSGFSFVSSINFPYIPIITNFSSNPISKRLESIMLKFASPIKYTGTTLQFTPIAFTSSKSGVIPTPLYFDVSKQWEQADFPLSGLTVAGILTGKIVGDLPSKMVIISNGDFAINKQGEQNIQLQPDNVNLLVNSVDWLSDQTGLMDLRTKEITSRPLDQISDGKKSFLKYLNFLLPILLIIIYGIIRLQFKNNLRMKRMEEGNV